MRKLIPMMLAMLLVPAAGYPLGLGEIRLHSALNQPLSAEIDLLSVGADDVKSITAGLASSEVFAQLGLDRTSTLLLVEFEVTQRPNGTYYVKASSKQAIREPYLDFLLEVNWRSGRVLREYTVLLDPPELFRQSAAAVQPPAANVAEPVLMEPTGSESVSAAPAADETLPAEAAPATDGAESAEAAKAPEGQEAQPAQAAQQTVVAAVPVAAPAPAPAKSGPITYGPVRGDETLWSIAKRMRPNRSATMEQVMAALVRENPKAFYGKNANRLRAGQVLRLDPAQLAAISREEAAREIALQGREWQDYRQRVAAQAAARSPSPVTETPRSPAVASAQKDEPRLKLVAPEESAKAPKDQAAAPGTGSGDADAVRKELMIAIETSEAQKQENDELRQRMTKLQEQLASIERLISIEDNDLASLQRQAAELGDKAKAPAQPAPTQAPSVALPPAKQPAPVQAAQPAPAQAAQPVQPNPAAPAQPTATAPPAAPEQPAQPAAQQPAQPAQPAVAAPEAPKPQTPATAPKKPKAAIPPPPAPAPEPSFISGLLSNPVALGGILLTLFAVVVIGFLALKRRRSGASFQESILMGSSPSMLKAKQAEAKPAEETSFFSDFAVSGMGDIHAEDSEVDPLTEADVYMAYQRFQQAEELLREAMKHNDRPELHVKLLEVFHATRDKAAFETEAVKANAMLGGKGPLWDKVLALGHELLPQHPLFAQAPAKAPAAAGASHADARLDNDVLDIGLDLDALAEEMEGGGGSQGGGEFNLDLGVDFSDLAPAAAAPSADVAVAERPAPAPAPAKKQEATLDFDLGDLSLPLDEPAAAPAKAKAEAKPAAAPTLDLGELELGELDLTGSAPDDAATLDLGEFDLGSLGLEEVPAKGAKSEPSLGEALDLSDLEDIKLEATPAGDDDEALFANLDEAGTKLDLARAYMEMGDPEGARSILDEVLQEGNAAQKQQAQELLKQIA